MKLLCVLALVCCGSAPVPRPELRPYAGQERCECSLLGFVRERPRLLPLRCEEFWGCGLDNTIDSCRVVCAWVDIVDGGAQ